MKISRYFNRLFISFFIFIYMQSHTAPAHQTIASQIQQIKQKLTRLDQKKRWALQERADVLVNMMQIETSGT